MQLLTKYFELQKQIYEHFGYVEDWVVIPLNDSTEYFWWCDGVTVGFASTEQDLISESGEYCENEVYTQRFLPKWVYTAEDFTMICVDTHTDGNKFLQVLDNAKKRERIEK